MTNIYDNNDFYDAYSQMPRSKSGLAAAGEWHQLQSLFPDANGMSVLDLGCGYGWHCKYAAEHGAASILGIDNSEKMIAEANRRNADSKITYRVCGIEDYEYPPETYHLVVSNLVFHYLADLDAVYQKVFRTLKTDGIFLFNIEHPVFTAGVNEDWVYGSDGRPLHWPVDNYYSPGKRTTVFLGRNVVKQHHTLTQILSGLLQNGFQIDAVEEAVPSPEMMNLPGMKDEMRRPMMLLVKAKKTRKKK